MEDLPHTIASSAEDALALIEYLRGQPLDYSEASLTVVQEVLEEVAGWEDELTPDQLAGVAEASACYVLESARRQVGGRYLWDEPRDQPLLVTGEPHFRVALAPRDLIQRLLSGEPMCNVPLLYAGFIERARRARPGDQALYV